MNRGLLILCLLMAATFCRAQDFPLSRTANNAILTEISGISRRTSQLHGALLYERTLFRKAAWQVVARTGLGLSDYRGANDRQAIARTFALHTGILYGRGRNFLECTGGVWYFFRLTDEPLTVPDYRQLEVSANRYWYAAIGYRNQKPAGGLLFRVNTGIGINANDAIALFPSVGLGWGF
jgi:hypothetical protein